MAEEHAPRFARTPETAFKNEMVLDAVGDKEEVTVDQAEMINYIITMSSQYGMDPNQFAQSDCSGRWRTGRRGSGRPRPGQR